MDKNYVEDICRILTDIVFVFEILNYKNNSYINSIVKELKSNIEELENKYT